MSDNSTIDRMVQSREIASDPEWCKAIIIQAKFIRRAANEEERAKVIYDLFEVLLNVPSEPITFADVLERLKNPPPARIVHVRM